MGILAEGEGSVWLTLSNQLLFKLTLYFSFFTKPPILMRRPTVLSLPVSKGSMPSMLGTISLACHCTHKFTSVIILIELNSDLIS